MPETERPATCGNCPHVNKLPDSTTLVCELAPPVPVLMTREGHQSSPREENALHLAAATRHLAAQLLTSSTTRRSHHTGLRA